ncbi:MAG: TAT-variant-translocated molybdopterin oxidoreductase [Planctomycetota bacterium]
MPPLTEQSYWQSLGELAGSEEFKKHLENEFRDIDIENPSSVSRRRFMQLMGASITLAGLTSCRWEKENILPQAVRGEGVIPGFPRRFATSMEIGGVSRPLLVTSRDGRPTKIEGNPLHAASLGSSDTFSQGAILGMCDPDRAKHPTADGKEKSWDDFFAAIKPVLDAQRGKQGQGLAVVSEATSSETMAWLREELRRAFPKMTWIEWEPLGLENVFDGTAMAYGAPHRPHYDLRQADVIVSLDADILGLFPDSARLTRDWASRRDPDAAMNRLYVVESAFSATGASADHRLPLRSSQIASFALALEERLAGRTPKAGVDAKAMQFIDAVADDLKSRGGRVAVIAGPQQPAIVHALCARINDSLGAVGDAVRYTAETGRVATGNAGLRQVVEKMNAGSVEALFVLGANPAYDAPADIDFATAMGKVGTSVHCGLYSDETGSRASWQLPQSHFLESWGEARAWDGSWTLRQPLVKPLHDTKSAIELVAGLLGRTEPTGLELVKAAMGAKLGTNDFESRWAKSLHDGFVAGTAAAPVAKPAIARFEAAAPGAISTDADGKDLEISFVADTSVWDGRFANNGWLQELPDFMSKLTWDNALLLGESTARGLGVDQGDMVRVTLRGRSLDCAVLLMPGQAPGTGALALGYGRTKAGTVGGDGEVDPVGFDAYRLRTSTAPGFDVGAKVEKIDGHYPLATTQEHHAIGDFQDTAKGGIQDRLKQLYRAGTVADYAENPGFANSAEVIHHPELKSLWKEHEYDHGHKWGMAIDLNKCVGCNACVTACVSENNIPVVGKSDVLKGREMHWLRIDRYFKGDANDPQAVAQPVTCMQCENAPCEQVCPVAATMHSAEGLNDMVYNRCVGTRYCANNCPYKVRRFNFFNYHKDLKDEKNETLKLAFNPDVTVRSRGVMEKCTFCVQRIKFGRQVAKNEGRELRDGDISSACQQACPSGAITFGDLNLAGSAVAAKHASPRAYAMLQELNVKPRVLFLARVTNPNPILVPKAEQKG